MKEKERICARCGERPARHTIFRNGGVPEEEALCCICYVNAGNPPADWHPDCMEAAAVSATVNDQQGNSAVKGMKIECDKCGMVSRQDYDNYYVLIYENDELLCAHCFIEKYMSAGNDNAKVPA